MSRPRRLSLFPDDPLSTSFLQAFSDTNPRMRIAVEGELEFAVAKYFITHTSMYFITHTSIEAGAVKEVVDEAKGLAHGARAQDGRRACQSSFPTPLSPDRTKAEDSTFQEADSP